MAVHDPESSLQEKQLALKIGRQKKIQIIDGQRVEVMTGKFRARRMHSTPAFLPIFHSVSVRLESFH